MTDVQIALPATLTFDLTTLQQALTAAGQPTLAAPQPTPLDDAPTSPTATPLPYAAMVAFEPGAVLPGKTLKGFTAVSTSQGWIQGSAPASPILATGGNPGWGGAANAVIVTAVYTDGTTGTPSSPSNAVLPTGGTGNATSPVIYAGGKFNWMGDYAYGYSAEQYANADGSATFFSTAQGGPQWWAPNSQYDVSAYTTLSIDLCGPPGETWVVFIEKQGDGGLPGEPSGGFLITPALGASTTQLTTYQVPLAALNIGKGTPNTTIYKVQCHGTLPGAVNWRYDNVKFS